MEEAAITTGVLNKKEQSFSNAASESLAQITWKDLSPINSNVRQSTGGDGLEKMKSLSQVRQPRNWDSFTIIIALLVILLVISLYHFVFHY